MVRLSYFGLRLPVVIGFLIYISDRIFMVSNNWEMVVCSIVLCQYLYPIPCCDKIMQTRKTPCILVKMKIINPFVFYLSKMFMMSPASPHSFLINESRTKTSLEKTNDSRNGREAGKRLVLQL